MGLGPHTKDDGTRVLAWSQYAWAPYGTVSVEERGDAFVLVDRYGHTASTGHHGHAAHHPQREATYSAREAALAEMGRLLRDRNAV